MFPYQNSVCICLSHVPLAASVRPSVPCPFISLVKLRGYSNNNGGPRTPDLTDVIHFVLCVLVVVLLGMETLRCVCW